MTLSFLDLCTESQSHVHLFLDNRSIIYLSCTSKKIHDLICENFELWQTRCLGQPASVLEADFFRKDKNLLFSCLKQQSMFAKTMYECLEAENIVRTNTNIVLVEGQSFQLADWKLKGVGGQLKNLLIEKGLEVQIGVSNGYLILEKKHVNNTYRKIYNSLSHFTFNSLELNVLNNLFLQKGCSIIDASLVCNLPDLPIPRTKNENIFEQCQIIAKSISDRIEDWIFRGDAVRLPELFKGWNITCHVKNIYSMYDENSKMSMWRYKEVIICKPQLFSPTPV